jgi:hypothetical protein
MTFEACERPTNKNIQINKIFNFIYYNAIQEATAAIISPFHTI